MTSQPIEAPDPAVFQTYIRVMDRQAKLLGLDMQASLVAPPVTREALAALLWDATDPPIDVEAEEEEPQEQSALGAG